MTLKSLAQGFGAAIILLALAFAVYLSPNHHRIYHSFLPMQNAVWGALIQLVVVGLLAALLFAWLHQRESGWRSVIWALVAAELLSALAAALTTLHTNLAQFLVPATVAWITLVVALVLRWVRPLTYLRAVRVLAVLLTLAGCSALWILPELLYQAMRTQRADLPVPLFQASLHSLPPPAPGGRIVWLLFDELSYDQVFDHRFPGLSLPAFDDLRRQSVVFSDLRPAGYQTDRIIPAFFLGKPVEQIRSTLDGDLLLRYPGDRKWHPFDAQATVFGDAQRLGWTTGVAGWFNPYCRVLAGTLNSCYWRMAVELQADALPQQSAWVHAVAPWADTWRALRHEPPFAQQQAALSLPAVMAQSNALLRDESIRFVFIHLPVPHPPGDYVDNLRLADRSLYELQKTINATSLAAHTTLIVCSDHSWRVPLWRWTKEWTPQDEAASHGTFDPRPVLMIHSPGQQHEREVAAPFDEIRIHEIIEGLLHGQGAYQ